MSSSLHTIFEVLPNPKVTNPQPTYQKDGPKDMRDIGVLPDIELEEYAARKNSHSDINDDGGNAPTPKTPNELEMSRPTTPTGEDAVGMIRTWNADPMTKWRILCCCVIYFSNGINDSGT